VLTLTLAGTVALAGDPYPHNLRDWQLYNNAGWSAIRNGDYATAGKRFRQAIEAIRPQEAEYRVLLARSYGDLAWVLCHQKRYAEAEPLARWCLLVRQADPKVRRESIWETLYLVAVIARGQRNLGQAESLLRHLLTLQEQARGTDHPQLVLTLDELAGVCRDVGKLDEAGRLYARAIAILEQSFPDENPQLAETLDHYAVYFQRVNRPEEAREMSGRARSIREAVAASAERARANRIHPAALYPPAGGRGS
jgi:tetratricopeptide (TPR) repeat protein